MTAYTFSQLIDFTRTSSATYVDSAGKIVPTAASRNLLTFTQEFDNAAWGKTGSTVYPFDPATASQGPELVANTTPNFRVLRDGVNPITSYATGAVLTTGKWYLVTFTITNNVGNTAANFFIGSVTIGAGQVAAGFTGTKTVYAQHTAGSLDISLVPAGATVDFVVSAFSVKELSGGLIAAPDGTFTADKLVDDTATALHFSSQTVTVTAGLHTFSTYVKAAGRNFAFLYHGASNTGLSVNLSTGALGQPTGTVAPTASSVTAVGNGWYRVTMTATTTAGSNSFRVYLATSLTGSASYAGDGISGIYIWGAQLEAVPDANLVLGSELAPNAGTFSSASGWTTGAGTTISGGLASTSSGTTGTLTVSTGAIGTVGKVYRVTITATSVTAGSFRPVLFGNALTTAVITTAGTYTFTVIASATDAYLQTFSSTTTGAISAFSVKEITGTTGMPTDYTRNNGGVYPPRFDYDPVTLAPRGLLVEEQRTNLLLRSEEFDNAAWTKTAATVTANAAASPDGTVDADKLVSTAATTQMSADGSVSVTSGTSYAFSVFAKSSEYTLVQLRFNNATFGNAEYATFNLANGTISQSSGSGHTIVNMGNGWYRCTIVAVATATATAIPAIQLATSQTGGRNPAITGDGTSGIFIYGAQLEAGSFATSYIPTVASQVTRTADVATITGANFSQWYNQSEGAFVAEFEPATVTQQRGIFAANDGAGNNRVDYRTVSIAVVTTGGVEQANLTTTGLTANAVNKAAVAYKVNDFAAVAKGGTVATDTSGTVPVVSRLVLGAVDNGANPLCGYIRSIRYYPTRLSNAQLQALTA